MQIFFAVACLLAVLALSNGAAVAPKSEQPRAEVEAQVAETAGQTRAVQAQATEQVAEATGQTRAAQAQVTEQVAAEVKSTGTEVTDGAVREKRTLLLRHLLRKKACRSDCSGLGCGRGCAPGNRCLQAGGCGSGCGGAYPCEPTNVMVVQRPVAVPTPVHIAVPVVKVVRHPVPVPQPIAVPVTKFVPVPVPVEQPCCSQPQPCCGKAPTPCSPCSG